MKITNIEAQRFFNAFSADRKINRDFYERVPESKFDFRLVDTKEKKSDSIRECLIHQINVQRTYMSAIQSGELVFGSHYDKELITKTKNELLEIFDELGDELKKLLTSNKNCLKKVIVPWNSQGINAIAMLWSLDSHEVLHTGWNLALIDALNIKRYPSLRAVWG